MSLRRLRTLTRLCPTSCVRVGALCVGAMRAASSSTHSSPGSSSSSSFSSSSSAAFPTASVLSESGSTRPAVEQMYAAASKKRDPFLREGTATSRFFRAYRTQLPFPARMFGIFLLGFTLGMIIEVFACKTHLYESVMMKKDARRHEFDEFVVDFRQSVERWQREDMSKRRAET